MGYESPKPKVLSELLKPSLRNALTSFSLEGSTTLSYDRLIEEVVAFSQALEDAGVSRGCVVSIVIPNKIEFVVAFLAAVRLGAIAAPLNATYTEDEFKFYLEDANASAVLVGPGGVPENAARAGKALDRCVWTVEREGEAVSLVTGDQKLPGGETSCSPEDVCLFLHTSGTTSKPKGVPLSHKNLCQSISNICATYELVQEDVTLLVMPLFHVHGLMCGLLSSLATGGEVVIPAEGRFSASKFWPAVSARGVTWYTAVPTIHQILLARVKEDFPDDAAEVPKLRFIRSCSSALAPATLYALEDNFKTKVLEAYAMTEAAHQMCSNPLHKDRRPGTVGMGTNVEVAMLSDSLEVLPPGSIGEVCIRGDNVTAGYLNNPDANKVAFAGGWFHTGDQGMLSEDGYVTLTGRIKELINRGGEKISPLEVDAALLAHPAVAEAVSFSAPDEKYGEVVNAAMVVKEGVAEPSAEDLKEFLSTRLATFKIPVKFFFDTQLPRTATGKIQRRIVAAHFLDK